MGEFLVGASKEIITPKIGAKLYGYNPNTISTSVNDDLTVTAIAAKQGHTAVIFLSASVCIISNELSDEIRTEIASHTSIPSENIILSATHTHSGPCTSNMFGWGDIDREYVDEIFKPKIIQAAKDAVSKLKPALMGVGCIKSRIGINRRQIMADNTVVLGQNPYGIHDDNLTVISFRDSGGASIANMIHYGAHCTAAGNNTEISRDWAGVMEDRLQNISGGITAFFNGAEGDSGPRLTNGRTTGDIRLAMEHGGLAAHEAVEAYRSIKEYRSPDLKAAYGQVRLPCDDMIPLEEAQIKLSMYKDESININGRRRKYYESVVEAYSKSAPENKELVIDQTIVKIGPVVFVPFPFEYFSEISLRLRENSFFPYTLGLGVTNGSYGYLPTESELCRGGYEVEMFLTGFLNPLKKDTDKTIVSENIRIMRSLL